MVLDFTGAYTRKTIYYMHSDECTDGSVEETKQPLTRLMSQQLTNGLMLQAKTQPSFCTSDKTSTQKDRWCERGARKAINVKVEKKPLS